MRSISNIARTHRRNNSNGSNTSSNSPKSISSKSPVWGRSATLSAKPLTSPSPSYASNNYSSSLSPRMWSRSKSRGMSTDTARSLSPPRQPRTFGSKETISGGGGGGGGGAVGLLIAAPAANSRTRSHSHSPHHRPQHSFDDSTVYNLATISENRRISSNTLNKITIKTPVSQLTKQLTESERSAQVRVRMIEEKTKTKTDKVNPYDSNENSSENDNDNDNDNEDCEICGGRGGCLSILNPKTFKNFFDRNSISIYSGRRSRKKQQRR